MRHRKITKCTVIPTAETCTQMKGGDLKEFRIQKHKEQLGICPILHQRIPIEDMVVDHCHKKKSEVAGVDGKGLVRGVIERSANVIEGKLTNAYTRYGLRKYNVSLPNFLRNLADYLEDPPLDYLQLIHPKEAPEIPKVMKRSYNKLKTKHNASGTRKLKKFPDFPKSGKMTVGLQKAYDYYKMKAEYYK